MFPLVANADEFRAGRAMVDREVRHLSRFAHNLPTLLKLGAMAELQPLGGPFLGPVFVRGGGVTPSYGLAPEPSGVGVMVVAVVGGLGRRRRRGTGRRSSHSSVTERPARVPGLP